MFFLNNTRGPLSQAFLSSEGGERENLSFMVASVLEDSAGEARRGFPNAQDQFCTMEVLVEASLFQPQRSMRLGMSVMLVV